MNLRIPGPTPLPPQVQAALEKPMIDHRGPEFAALQKSISARLKQCCQTQHDIILYTSSGTGGLEAALANTLSPGDNVLAFVAGEFGERIAALGRAFGGNVTKFDFPQGAAIDPDRVRAEVQNARDLHAVLVTHNETSTGILHPLQAIARAVRENSDALLIVDGVSSLGATDVQIDAWGIDVIVTASQKAWMCPPGLSMVSISPRAWKAYAASKNSRYYWDWAENRVWMEKGQTPFTPALPVYFALDVALDMIRAEGLQNVFARHARIAAFTVAQAAGLGLTLFGDARYSSPTVTALNVPPGVAAEELRKSAREEFGLVIGGGQGPMRGKIIRIGHLGWVQENDISEAMTALAHALERVAV